MAEQTSQKFCPNCNADRLFTKPATNHLVHAIVTLFLCGMWIPIWILATMSNNTTKARCTQCGSHAGKVNPSKDAALLLGAAGLVIVIAFALGYWFIHH